MSVTIVDLAHDRQGFETDMIRDIEKLLDSVGLEVEVMVVHLSVLQNPPPTVNANASVVVVVCHGEPHPTPGAIVVHGQISVATASMYLDAEVDGLANLLGAMPQELADTMRMSILDPSMLNQHIVMPKRPFGIVWLVCNSFSADVATSHWPLWRASVAFHGDFDASQSLFVMDVVDELHRQLQSGDVIDLVAFERFRRVHGDSWNAAVWSKESENSLELLGAAQRG
jgi:hypothetical protein